MIVGDQATDHASPDYYRAQRLPTEFRQFEADVPQLEVGRAGKVGLLELTLEPQGGVTRVRHLFHKVPLQMSRSIYPDAMLPGMAFVYIMSPGGGILQGDRYRLDIMARAGSHVHVTTQAATKIYRMEWNYASQLLNLAVGPDAYVEYLPDPIIPYRDARFYQETNLVVHRGGTLIYGEVIVPGRVAHGEVFAYRLYYNRTEATNEHGKLLFVDTVKLTPQDGAMRKPGLFGSFDVLGTLYVLSSQVGPRALANQLHEYLQEQREVAGAAGELPDSSGVLVRVLGPNSRAVLGVLHAAWEHIRMEILGIGLPPLRK